MNLFVGVFSQRFLPYGPISDARCDSTAGTATSKSYSNFEMALSKCEQVNCDVVTEFEVNSRWRSVLQFATENKSFF